MNKTNMQRIKGLIAECNEAAEMVGIINGIEAAAVTETQGLDNTPDLTP